MTCRRWWIHKMCKQSVYSMISTYVLRCSLSQQQSPSGLWHFGRGFRYNFICRCFTGRGCPFQIISINLMSFIYVHTISSSEGPCPSTPTQLGTSSTVANRYWRIMTSSFLLSSMWQELARTPMYKCMPCCYAHTVSKNNAPGFTTETPTQRKLVNQTRFRKIQLGS